MARKDIRSDGRSVPLTHHSARGQVQRNAGNFTRGSQLVTHETLMWFSGARLPFIFWFFTLMGAWFVIASIRLDENGFQLVVMKAYAWLWMWIEFDPMTRVDLKMPDESIFRTVMARVEYVPAVIRAWDTAVRAALGALLVSIFITIPAAIWFVDLSRRRGKGILQERHERGAMLVDTDLLRDEVVAHNRSQFMEDAAKLLPALLVKQVLALPLAERKKAGIHHPYTLAGIPYPYRLEQSHTMLIGTTGSGKTTVLRHLVGQIRKHEDTAVIFDLTGAYVEAFYDPARDTILNPMDVRCPAWSIFDDCSTYSEFIAASAALIPSDGGSSEPFWALAARTLFVEMCMKLIERKQTTNKALADNLMRADLKKVHVYLKDTIADPLTAPEAARMAESIRAVFNTNAQVLRFLPDTGPSFSIRNWITAGKAPGSILFITSHYVDLPMNRALLTLWMDLAINSLMTLPRTRDLRTWFMFDELGALHRLPAIENGLQTARGFGGAMILGLHSFEKLKEVYGEEGARNLASLARTKLILATADLDTAEQCSRYIGNREVRQMDEAYSYGFNNTRDASTLTPRRQVEPLVLPDDITNLPSMHGFVKFPDGFPAARIKLTWRNYAQVAEGFVRRPFEEPTPPVRGSGVSGEEEGEEAGGRDGAGQIVDAAITDPVNLAKDQASQILNDEPRDEHDTSDNRDVQGTNDRTESDTDEGRTEHRNDAAQAANENEPAAATRDGGKGKAGTPPAPAVEDPAIVELRQDMAPDDPGHDEFGI